MTYITSLFIYSLIILFLSSFVSIKSLNHKFYTNLFFGLSITTILTTALFAIYFTKGKTIFILIPIIVLYLFINKTCKLDFSFKNFKKKLNLIVVLLIILLFQAIFNYDFLKQIPYNISDDIYDYASNSYQLIKYGNENRSPLLSDMYPSLFSGIQPYHFFEIWLNGIFFKFNNGSVVYNLIYVTYPFMLWILTLGYLAIIEYTGFNKQKSIIILLLFFIGPVYFNIYSLIFNDGNFLDSSVFTVVGFVKQTLPFSYFGQKHLPIYVVTCGLILSYLNINFRLLFSFTLFTIISSIGLFPGFVFASLLLFRKKKIRKHLLFPVVIGCIYLLIFKFFGFSISKEIALKTNYSNHLFLHLNWKGEFIRVIEKIIFPFIWYSILYLPFLVLLFFGKNQNQKIINKYVLFYILLTYFGGVITTIFLYGINSDQFSTNLLPFYNLILIVGILNMFKKINPTFKKPVFIFCISFIIFNMYSLFNFQFIKEFKGTNNEKYDEKTQILTYNYISQTSKNKRVAYILSDKIVKNTHPVFHYAYYPAKFLMEKNIIDYVNINYPYYKYKFNSSSNVFSPENQLKYFIEENKLPDTTLFTIQKEFLKKYKINWILCSKDVVLPEEISIAVVRHINDPISKENYYNINLELLD